MPADVATEIDDPRDGAAPPPPFTLTVLLSPDPAVVGRVIELGACLEIGRAGPGLAIEDARLSRAHARVVRQPGGGFRVEDSGSANGTYVDGKNIDRCELAAGAVLRMGQTLMVAGPADPLPAGFCDDQELIGRSGRLRQLLAAVDRVAPTAISVLVTGESGTGKELVARRLHARSGRAGQLVAVNCGAIPAQLVESLLFGHRKGAFTGAGEDAVGYFGAADRGTLFLDEISTLPLELQPALLRVLETREVTPVGTTAGRVVDVRLVAATNTDLAADVQAGRFRQDLYARVAEYAIETPPLRRRRTDIPLLISHFVRGLAPGRALAPTVGFIEELLLRDYPMNVRELRAAIQHAVLEAGAAGTLEASMLPPRPPPPEREAGVGRSPSREELEEVLIEHGGNLARVARHYGRPRMQIYRWLEKHALDPGDYRGAPRPTSTPR